MVISDQIEIGINTCNENFVRHKQISKSSEFEQSLFLECMIIINLKSIEGNLNKGGVYFRYSFRISLPIEIVDQCPSEAWL